MAFALSKILLYLILPPAGIVILLAVGLLLIPKKRSAGVICSLTALVLLYTLSIDPVSHALIKPLERSHPPLMHKPLPVDAIVVLTGGVRELTWTGLAPEPSALSLERLVGGVTLYRTLRRPLIIAGGTGLPFRTASLEADAMARVAAGLGVPEKDIVIEHASRNTLESARAVRSMLKSNRIILVTSAFHMKRSVAMFKGEGFEVVPAPTGYRCEQMPLAFFLFIPRAGSLETSSLALSEYASLFWYSVRGFI